MKRYIRSNSIKNMISRVAYARRKLKQYDPEAVAYVQECYDEVCRAISDRYFAEFDPDDYPSPLPSERQIKEDYCLGAIEDGLMSYEEFDEIYDLVEILGEEEAHSQA